MPEHARPVSEAVLQKAAVRHRPDVARRRQCVRAQRSIHEVVVRDAGEFVEAERHFELTNLNLRVLDVREVDVDVLPLRLRRETLEDLLLGQLLFRELALDLVLDVFEQVPLDADTIAMQLPGARSRQRVTRALQPGCVRVGPVRVLLELRFEVHPER